MKSIPLIIVLLSLKANHSPVAVDSSTQEFSGVFSESFEEKLFFQCDGYRFEPAWWVRFAPGVGAGPARYGYNGPGMPTQTHYLRVKGTLSKPGSFGDGFHSRELLVDSVMEIADSIPCASAFDAKPTPWKGAGDFHRPAAAAIRSADGSIVAVASSDGQLSVWQTASGQLVTKFRYADPAPAGSIPTTTLALSSSGKLIAIGKSDGWVQVWTLPKGRMKWQLDNSAHADSLGSPGKEGWEIYGTSPVNSLAFTSDDAILATAGGHRAYSWSMSSGERISRLAGLGRHDAIAPSQIAMLHNPDRIIGFARDGTLRVYGPNGGSPLFVSSAPLIRDILGPMTLSPDESTVAIRIAQDSMMLWSLEDGRTRKFGVPTFFLEDVAFSPDGKQFAMPGSHFAVYVWNTATGEPIVRVAAPQGAMNLWFSQNGDSLVMSSVWDSTLFVTPLRGADLRMFRPGAHR